MERRAELSLEVISLGDGLELCPIHPEHAPELYALVEVNRARLREWLPWLTTEYSLEHATRFAAESEAGNTAGDSLTMVIRADNRIAGAIGLHTINQAHRSTSIGYWLGLEFKGRGIVTTACRALVTHGFRAYGLHRIEIRCATQNFRSAAVAQRLGFKEEGLLREAEWLYDHWVDLRVFSMLEHDWPATSATPGSAAASR